MNKFRKKGTKEKNNPLYSKIMIYELEFTETIYNQR